jgi:hypothetical protein
MKNNHKTGIKFKKFIMLSNSIFIISRDWEVNCLRNRIPSDPLQSEAHLVEDGSKTVG